MDIIERAARALCEQGGFDPAEIMANDGPRWKYYVPMVRSTLAAIREPSNAMIGAASDVTGILHDEDIETEMKAIWQAMIDAALSD